MKYVKERNFVKSIFEENQKELKKSTIVILESTIEKGQLTSVLFEDRFGNQYECYINKRGEKIIKELT